MHERHPRSGASGRAAASKTLEGRPSRTAPWHPPLAPRRVVPAPPPPTPKRAPALTLKQGFGVPEEEDGATRIYGRGSQDSLFPDGHGLEEVDIPLAPGATIELADEDATRAWGHAEARHAAGLWGDSSQDPSATANVTQDEVEELRLQLQLGQDRKVSIAPTAPSPALETDPELNAPEPIALQSRPRRRTVVKWLTSVAVLTFIGLGVVAHQTGYLSRLDVSQLDVARFDVSEDDVRPLLSGLGKAQAILRTEYDKLFSVKQESRPAPTLPLAPVPLTTQAPPRPLTTQAPIPIVEQLQEGDLNEDLDEVLPSSEPSLDDVESTPNDLSALIYEDRGREADEQALSDSETPFEEGDPQP